MPVEGMFKKGTIVLGLIAAMLISGCIHNTPIYDDEHGYRARVPDGGRTTNVTSDECQGATTNC